MKRYSILLIAALLLLLFTAPPALAAPTGACYLTPAPNAIANALNNLYCLIIYLGPGTYQEHSLVVNRDIVIQGASKTTTTVDGQLLGRVFYFSNANSGIEISDLTIRNGQTTGYGGAILSYGKLSVRNVIFLGNQAFSGGAIYASALLTSIRRSTFKSNVGTDSCGAVATFGVSTIDGSTFEGNRAGNYGGAVCNSRPLDISRSTFKNNRVTGANSQGGAISVFQSVQIDNSTFTANTAAGGGGAILVQAGQIDSIYVRASTFTGNKAGISGGAIYITSGPSFVQTSSFTGNAALKGGAIAHTTPMDALYIQYSTLNLNKAQVTTLPASTEPVVTLSPAPGEPDGVLPPVPRDPDGGEPAGGAIYNTYSAFIQNSTLSGNTTTGFGGGVYTSFISDLSFVTMSGNRAAQGGDIFDANTSASQSYIKNTILNAGAPQNYAGAGAVAFQSFGGNLSSDHSGDAWLTLPSDRKGVNPRLGLLANNGGPTKTHALLLGSPAINHALDCKDASGTVVQFDQRLRPRPRPVGGLCDIGAYER